MSSTSARKAKVREWIERVRPGCFVYADEMLVIENAHRAFVDAGHECSPSEFRFALHCLGLKVEPHTGGCRLLLDNKVA